MRRLVRFVLPLLVLAFASAASAEPSGGEDREAQARAFFASGVAHFDRGEMSAALADFLRSRELFPSRVATINAAICLRKENRFDEALDLYEEVLRTYADLDPNDRGFTTKEIAELKPLVGAIEFSTGEAGASIVIDGRERGIYPPSGPLRVAAGPHVVRAYKTGFLQLERGIVVAGRQILSFDATLTPLAASGRLVVTEVSGRVFALVVDNVEIGRTPFEGSLPVGRHVVALRGESDEGTAPVDALIAQGEVTTLGLAAEKLDSALRVVPTPAGALVSIDGVVVGHGVWEGKLRSGPHTIEVAAEGYAAQKQSEVLAKGTRSSVEVGLERDVTSTLWLKKNPARVFAEIDGGPGVGFAFGGEVRSSCAGSCSAQVPIGVGATLHGGYQFSSGLAIGVDAGLLALAAGTTGRSTELTPQGGGSNAGTADDALYLRGFRVGPSVGYRFGEDVPITLRLGVGMFVGSGGDARTGTFTTSGGGRYDVSVSESARAIYVYAAPEVRMGKRLGPRFDVSGGLAFHVLAAVEAPSWSDVQAVNAAPAGQRGDGIATFGAQSMAGTFVFAAVPSIGARYAF
jgi:hypothetical protein